MKCKILLITLFASVLLLSACSFRYDFVVVNKSDEVIQVRYKLKRYTPETPGKYFDITPPAKLSVKEFQKSDRVWRDILSVKEFQKSDRVWRDIPKEQYVFDNLTGTFTIKVAPSEALLIDSASNYRGDESQFALESINITGAKGSINLEGKQVQTQFKVESNTYVIQYR